MQDQYETDSGKLQVFLWAKREIAESFPGDTPTSRVTYRKGVFCIHPISSGSGRCQAKR
jgi:hypothetical protein